MIKSCKKVLTAGKGFLFFVCFFPTAFVSAAGLNFPVGTRPAGLANTYVTQSGLWSVYHNQAGLGFHEKMSLGFHHENRFVVEEFSLHALAFTYPFKPGTFGISYSYFGYEDYNVSKIGLGFGKHFGSNLAAGVQLNYHSTFIAGDYETRGSLSVEGGVLYKPSQNLSIGVHLFNPTASSPSYYESDTLTTSFKTGLGFTPSEKLFIGVEIEKHLERELIFKSGIEYRVIESLYLRTGISTNPVSNTFGIGYKIGKISADVAFTRHQILGFTPHFSLQIEW